MVEGEVKFTIKSAKYVLCEVDNATLTLKLDDFVVSAINNYDYDNFINLVNKINKDNVLSSLEELIEANNELENINVDNVSRDDVKAALALLETLP